MSALTGLRPWQTRWSPQWRLSHEGNDWSSDLGFGGLDIFRLAHRFGDRAAPVIEGILASIDDHWTEDMHCLSDLVDAGVEFSVAPPRPGIQTPVLLTGTSIGGIPYRDYYPNQEHAPMDCRLVRTLVRAGPVLANIGVTEVVWSSAYRPPTRKQLMGLEPLNKHNLGLAIDVHEFQFGHSMRADVGRQYERGLGFQSDASCLGHPVTRKGLLLRLVICRLDESDLFQEILTPDFDGDHWNHFHIATFRAGDHILRRHKRTALLEVPMEKIPGWAMSRRSHARPDERRWESVAQEPWPRRYEWLHKLVMDSPIAAHAVIRDRRPFRTNRPSIQVLQRISRDLYPGAISRVSQDLH